MTTPLAQSISTKIKTDKLSLEAAAKAIDVSVVSLRGVLKGKSRPNKSTATKYAKFSGLSVEEILGSSKSGKKAAKRTKKAGKATGARVKKAVAARKSKSRVSGQDLLVSVSQAAALLDDDLAVRVHGAPKTTRDLIDRILG